MDTVLWTYQPGPFVKSLKQNGEIRSHWDLIQPPTWLPAYQWMAGKMVERGLCNIK